MIRQATLPLLFALSPTLQSDPAEAMERRVRRAALRREPVVLGTAATPYEPPARGESPLRTLLPLADGLEVAITTATPRRGRRGGGGRPPPPPRASGGGGGGGGAPPAGIPPPCGCPPRSPPRSTPARASAPPTASPPRGSPRCSCSFRRRRAARRSC